MKKRLLTIGVILLGLPCVALAGSNSTVASWFIEEADAISSEDVNSGSSLALGGDGKAHISYSVNGALQYATNKSGTWEAETVDATENTRFYSSSLALDSDGKAHISYYDYTNGDLKYATNMSGAWGREILDSEGDTGVGSSIALDREDKVHIIYYDRTNRSVKYTNNKSGVWVTEIVGPGGHDSFVLDTDGKAHISYSGPDGLQYATNKSGVWVTETVDRPLEICDTSLALDANGHAHICNAHYTGIRYSTNKSGSWITETVDDGYNEGIYCSLAVDAKGRVHISYMVEGSGSNYPLKYATNKCGTWETEIVDVEAGPGIYSPSIALDIERQVHISYYKRPDIYYAHNDDGGDCIHKDKTTIPTSTTTSVPPNEGFCGDGITNGEEECDGSDLGGETCESLGLIWGGILACEEGCTFNMSGCYTSPEHCGNGTLDPGEDCDTPGVCCFGNCTFRPEGALCSDGEFCNGQETCDDSGMCNPGIPVDCDDGISCTDDFCDPDSDTCVNIPDDSVCPDDGLYCNGDEFCNPRYGCRHLPPPCRCAIECNEETDTCDPLPPIYFYRSDFLEEGNPGGWDGSSLKSFEDMWTLSLGETVDVDIWLTDLPEALLTGGFFITYDPTQVNITNVVPNDTNNGGPWDASATHSFEVEPGQWFLVLLSWPPCAEPDGGQDVLLARVTFERVGTGNAEVTISTIPDETYDTVYSCGGAFYDCQIPLGTITINDGFEISSCCGDFNLDNDVDGSDAAIFKRDYGRSPFFASSCTDAELCYGDFDCDTDVDGNDAYKFKVDFGRSLLNSPCQESVTGERCAYP